jgi:hypothetical protein
VPYIGIVVESGNGTLHYEGQLVVIGIIRRMPLRFASRALMERLLLPQKVGPPFRLILVKTAWHAGGAHGRPTGTV